MLDVPRSSSIWLSSLPNDVHHFQLAADSQETDAPHFVDDGMLSFASSTPAIVVAYAALSCGDGDVNGDGAMTSSASAASGAPM